MKKLLLLILFSSTSLLCHAQSWHELLQDGETDFKSIQNAFYTEWKDKPIKRGTGYMQFKRWEELTQLRLTPDGKITNIAENFFIKKRLSSEKQFARSENEDPTWTSLGPYSWETIRSGYNPGNGRINSIYAVGDEQNTLYIGAPVGGLWRQTDEAEGWELLTEDLANIGVTDIYVNPENHDHLMILTGDAYGSVLFSIGILESEDGGVTWDETGLIHEFNSNIVYFKMEVLPSNTDIMLVAGSQGIKRSADGGSSWIDVLSNVRISDMIVHPENDAIIYASFGSSLEGEVIYYKSTDAGVSWQAHSIEVPDADFGIGRTALAVSPMAPDFVYLLAADQAGGLAGVFRSTNAGETFELRIDSPNIVGSDPEGNGGQGWYDLTIAVNPEDAEEVYVGGFYTFKSTNGASSFVRLHEWQSNVSSHLPYMHPDIHTLDFYNGQLYAGTDGGIYTSDDQGETWVDLSSGLGITMFYRLGQDQNNADIVIGGTQDNGSNIFKNGGWLHIYGADGMEALVDYEDGDIVYSSLQFGSIFRYSNGGESLQSQIAGSGITERGNWVTPYMLDPINHQTIYAGYSQLYRSSNQGDAWTVISDFTSTGLIRDFDIARTDPDFIYVTDGNTLFRTEDRGIEWIEISAGLPNAQITKVEVSENDENTIWVTLGGFLDGQKVYRSMDKGATWINYSDGLPNVVTYCIVHQRDSKDQLYIGTDLGVFQRNLEMDSWQYYSNGLPGVITRELEIHETARKIRAATFGRGIWETSLNESTTIPISLEGITVNQNEILEGLGVVFEATKEGNVRDYLWEFEGGSPATSTVASPFVIYEGAGEFDAKLTITGAIDSKSITVENIIKVSTVTSVDDEDAMFNIFPNPADNQLTIRLGNAASEVTYELITSEGKSVLNKQVEGITGDLSIDLKDLPEGVYFLQLKADEQQVSRKIVISR